MCEAHYERIRSLSLRELPISVFIVSGLLVTAMLGLEKCHLQVIPWLFISKTPWSSYAHCHTSNRDSILLIDNKMGQEQNLEREEDSQDYRLAMGQNTEATKSKVSGHRWSSPLNQPRICVAVL